MNILNPWNKHQQAVNQIHYVKPAVQNFYM